MPRTRRRILILLWILMIGLPLLAITVYAINPFGAHSLDPRLRLTGYGTYRIASSSMAPTLQPNQIVITRVLGIQQALRRGDVVTRLVPESPGNQWIQRIVGLPGETLAIEDGRVLINGAPLDEPYVAPENNRTPYSREFPAVRIPADHFFMLGDNRDNSEDSRLISLARREDITGRMTSVSGQAE